MQQMVFFFFLFKIEDASIFLAPTKKNVHILGYTKAQTSGLST